MRKKKSALEQGVKDIGMFGMGSMIGGASASAVSPFGSPATKAVTGVSTMMPVVGTLVATKIQVGMLGEAMDKLPKMKKGGKKR